MQERLQCYDENADSSAWIRALAELRHRAAREGYCYQHVQAITVAIDQYAEKALGNSDYFLNKPYGAGNPMTGVRGRSPATQCYDCDDECEATYLVVEMPEIIVLEGDEPTASVSTP